MMQNATIEINGNTYRINRLPAMTQFHVLRKLAPVLPTIAPVISTVAMVAPSGERIASEAENDKAPSALMGEIELLAMACRPLADALADLPDNSAEYVIDAAMSCVLRKDGKGFSSAWEPSSHQPMYDDIDTLAILALTWHSLKFSLSPFWKGIATNPFRDQAAG